ncbi:extracellular protein, membrane-anchored [Lactiplantibacillus paraplantarum DSM 10667]|nr:extracellular protein, membrane-anchored [Lactiplantibacillus paraplantarum DSM 10667]
MSIYDYAKTIKNTSYGDWLGGGVMKQFWSLVLMILAGCLLIFGSEYSLQGDYHRHVNHLTVSKVVYHHNATSATISGRTKHGIIVTLRSGKHVRQVISNKQSGQFYVKMPVNKRVTIKVVGLKPKTLTVPTGTKS